jgi:glyoxylase-like metal-dependent hydrolase (beta-lactamase superfamily II)
VGFGAFIVGDKGVIVIDTGGSPGVGKQIVDAVAKVTPLPITTLILSHDDADHVDGIAAFPSGMEIIAQENSKKFIADAIASGDTGPEAPKVPAAYLPNHTVAKREVRTIDGVKLELLHWAPAHTNADLVVYLPDQKLVLLGDLLVMDQHDLPLIHMEKGGTSKGWIESVKGVLALDATKYVVGHEGVVGRDGIEKQLQAAVAEREKVKQLYDKGMSLADIQAAVGDPIPPPPGVKASPAHFPPYSEVLYTELKEGKY